MSVHTFLMTVPSASDAVQSGRIRRPFSHTLLAVPVGIRLGVTLGLEF